MSSSQRRGPAGMLLAPLSRLRFPQLFVVAVVLFLLDMLVPDAIPFMDELLLGILALLFGMWRKPPEVAEKPPMKNVTPDAK